MGSGIERRARSRKARGGLRGWLARPPDPREVGERLARLARRMLKRAVVEASSRRIALALHPGAPPVRIAVLPDGALEVRGETAAVGPGYHAEVLARLAPILDELEYAWEDASPEPPESPAALAALQTELVQWLAGELRGGATRIGMPADRSFRIDAAVLTALGPRDAAWRDAAIAEPTRGADAFAWWDRGPGHEARSRALLAMWHDVAWREPLDDSERAAMERVDEDLAAAWRADHELALPWAAWAELLDWLGRDDAAAERIRRKAGDAPAQLGYRRHPMEIDLAGGWSIVLPGAFASHVEDDGARWWATDGDRLVEFTSLTADGETDSERLLAVAPEAHPVIARFSHGAQRGRAEAYDEDDVHVVHGLMVRAPDVGILTCKGGAADRAWALETWRSLRR